MWSKHEEYHFEPERDDELYYRQECIDEAYEEWLDMLDAQSREEEMRGNNMSKK